MMDIQQRDKQSWLAISYGFISNVLLAIAKIAVGIMGHSPALLADGINSTSDVVYYIVISVFMRAAHVPPDEDHPYGHRQLESIGALLVGAFVITSSVAIFWNSVNTIFDLVGGIEGDPENTVAALTVALVTIAIKIYLVYYTRNIGQQTNNASIIALAADHRNDILSASAAALGISIAMLGYTWVDPLAGTVVAIFVFTAGLDILRESTNNLMDTLPGQTLHQQIFELTQGISEVLDVEEIIAQKYGHYFVVTLTISVDGEISVQAGDEIADKVEAQLMKNIPFLQAVHIHYHPTH